MTIKASDLTDVQHDLCWEVLTEHSKWFPQKNAYITDYFCFGGSQVNPVIQEEDFGEFVQKVRNAVVELSEYPKSEELVNK